MFMTSRPLTLLFFGSVLFLFVGCRSLGPDSIRSNRGAYIEALSQTDKEEMLANIVRAKYNDPPIFLKIKTISAAPSLEMGAETQGNLKVGSDYGLIKPRLIYREAPSILYTPLIGSDYSTQLLMPMGLMNLFLMLNNGFDVEVIADLMIININGKTNSRGASDSLRMEFKNTINALGTLYRQKLINFATTKDMVQNPDPAIIIDVRKEAYNTAEFNYLVNELDLKPNTTFIEMKLGFNKRENVMAVNTRSFLALINYLSNYVDVPDEHSNRVWRGNFDASRGNLHIYCCKQLPQDANTAVYLYNHWYYIKSDDISSQNILYLIQVLFDLQAHIGTVNGNVQLIMPVR